MLNYEPTLPLHPPPRAIPAVDVRAHYTLPGGLVIVVVVHQRRHRPPPPPSLPSRGWLLLGAACRHHHPHHCRPLPTQPHQRRRPRCLASSSSPPCNPPPPRRRCALSALSIAHGAILDWHAVSTPSGMTRPVPIPPVPLLSKDGPIVPAPPSRPPRCLSLTPLRRPELYPPSLLRPPPPVGQRQQQHVDVDARPGASGTARCGV